MSWLRMKPGILPRLSAYVALSTAFFGLLLYRIVLGAPNILQEFDDHILIAKQMAEQHIIACPHFLYHLLTIAAHELIRPLGLPTDPVLSISKVYPFDWGVAGVLVAVCTFVAMQLLLLLHFHRVLGRPDLARDTRPFLIAFSISIVTPIFLLAPYDGLFYLGYISPATIYVIPTQQLLKLTALALFLLTPRLFDEASPRRFSIGMLLAGLVVMCGLSKPNYLLIMLPSLALFMILAGRQHRKVNRVPALFTVTASTATLAWQYYFTFLSGDFQAYTSSIALSPPFEVLRYHSRWIALKIPLSIVFPLFVTAVFWQRARHNLLLQFGWSLFLIGLVQGAFLIEAGEMKYAGNFLWSSQIGCFMLFVAAATFFFTDCPPTWVQMSERQRVALILLSLHAACGMIYYVLSYWSYA